MKKKTNLLFAIVLTFTISLQAQTEKLRYVVDGDTVRFSQTTCRLAYIDTPESKSNNKAKKDIRKDPRVSINDVVKAGRISKNYLKSIMRKGKVYSFDVTTIDRYGRSVCIIYKNDQSVNDMIISNGFGVPFWRYIPKSMQPKYRNLMTKADNGGRGLWRTNRPVMEMMK